MFRKPTVLVLGAGASAPYGFPLGNKLLANIKKGIETLVTSQVQGGARHDFIHEPYRALKQIIYAEHPEPFGKNFFQKKIHELKNDLDSNHRSIDEFVRINPRWREIVKIFVALEILCKTLEEDPDYRGEFRPNKKLTATNTNSWYGGLVAELRRGAHNPIDLGENKLEIVSFNYDRSIEHFFEQELLRGEIFTGFDMARAPRVNHVHGEISAGAFPFTRSTNFWQLTAQAAKQFRMIDEFEQVSQDTMAVARSTLNWAARIFILGFDLHASNVSALELDSSTIADKCVLLNWDGSLRVQQRATAAGFPEKNFRSGTKTSPLEIASAIEDGLFE